MNANETLFSVINLVNKTENSTVYNVCIDVPPHIVSDGIWGSHTNSGSPMRSSYPVFELQVIVIFAAGLILGPSIHIEALDNIKKMLFPYGSEDTLATISSLGYGLFIFLYGVQMDYTMVIRTGRKSWVIAFIGLFAPIIFGFSLVIAFGLKFYEAIGERSFNLPVVFISHSITSFAVVAAFLNDLKLLNTELGRLALSSALVSDILSSTFTSIATVVVSSTASKSRLIVNLISLFLFTIIVPLVCRPAMLWIVRHTPEGRPVKQVYLYNIIALVFAICWLSSQSDQSFTLGAFIFGLSVPEGPPLGSALVSQLELLGKSFLLPIFITTCVMKADLSLDLTWEVFKIVGVVIVITHLVKIAACMGPALYCKMPFKDALALALILNCKGVVEVGMYISVFDRKQVHGETFGVLMLSVMVISTVVQILVKRLYDPSRKYAGFQKRNIMNLKPNSEFRLLVCIHKQHHISGITNFLDICNPTHDYPIIVDALHLMELVGRTAPVFISHRLQRDSNLGLQNSYSENVFMSFQNYEHSKSPGAASTNTYTAISPLSLMHEDVCHLALDKLASIVILPFHRRWSIDGLIESEDKSIRSLNTRVLQMAPCSVGILVNRAAIPNEPNASLHLAVIFFGGKDDREALCLAKRACTNPSVRLVVYHLPEKDSSKQSSLDKLLDNAVLKDIMEAHYGTRVKYREIAVDGETDITSILRDIVHDHDFFIVGRRHDAQTSITSGLKDWCEFDELGVVGDLLASPDFESTASVLVVQQQQVCM
ncbi:cation/H(+) antiporter 4-like [Senna tora]|uniref:Cation/H(+) antiporter 4-like n=1 Tax=Senna tora TaxID=362788 RepID=A0A834SG39_9FABA|nr:cation/H(+) antiporter 4-like [Senna tora]